MTSPILLTQGLAKVFTRGLFLKASNTALKDVSLRVERGRTLVMLGQSDSGKTTFARLAARLMKPSDGKIVFDGRDITGLEGEELRNIRKELQIVFQDPYSSLDGMKTVHRLLSEALESHYSMSPSEVEDRCRSILAECALQEDILPRKVDQFSGGQRQRIALARSLILSPSFLIADEITSALDVVTQEGIVDMLRSSNPNVIINSRIQDYGDYATPEQGMPVTRPADKYWELCMTMNDSWGYQPTDQNYKTPQMLLRTFVDCLSMGGNLLLGIGPREDGSIPDEQVAILKAFGRWIDKHKEAVYETRAGIPSEHFQGYTTLNPAGDILYLYIPYRPNGPVEIKGLMNKVHRVWVVGNGAILPFKVHNKNYWNDVPGNLYIDVPEQVLDENITVIAVLLDGPIRLYRGTGQVITIN